MYKSYLVNDNDIIDNNLFKQQLYNDLECQGIDSKNIERLNYNKRDLETIFISYNECINSPYIIYKAKSTESWFSLSLKVGFNYGSLSINQNSRNNLRNFDFDNTLNFRFGIESEFFLPFNKKRFSIIVEPTFHTFKSEKDAEGRNLLLGLKSSRVNYQSIELPVAVRYHFYFNSGSQTFFNISSIVLDFTRDSAIDIIKTDNSAHSSLNINSGWNLAVGIGYKHKERYSLEMRYQLDRDILRDHASWNTHYKRLSVMFGYSLF